MSRLAIGTTCLAAARTRALSLQKQSEDWQSEDSNELVDKCVSHHSLSGPGSGKTFGLHLGIFDSHL